MNTAADAQTVSITPASFDFLSLQRFEIPTPPSMSREAAPIFGVKPCELG